MRCVPHPALKVHPVYGGAPADGASRSARVATWDGVVLRPVYCERPAAS